MDHRVHVYHIPGGTFFFDELRRVHRYARNDHSRGGSLPHRTLGVPRYVFEYDDSTPRTAEPSLNEITRIAYNFSRSEKSEAREKISSSPTIGRLIFERKEIFFHRTIRAVFDNDRTLRRVVRTRREVQISLRPRKDGRFISIRRFVYVQSGQFNDSTAVEVEPFREL